MSVHVKFIAFLFLWFGIHSMGHAQETFTLKRAIKEAKSNNPTLVIERYEIGFAEADLRDARLSLNPNFEIEPVQIINRAYFEKNTSWHHAKNREVAYQISKPFRWLGQRENEIEVAQKGVKYAKGSFAELERNIFKEVALQWLEIWGIEKENEVIQNAKRNVDSVVKINRIRYQKDVITKNDVLRAELLAKQYDIKYATILEEGKKARRALGRLLGKKYVVGIDKDIKAIYETPLEKNHLLNQAFKERTDLRSIEQMMSQEKSNLKLQKSLSIPQPELGIVYNPMAGVPYVGLSLAMELPFFNRNQEGIYKARQKTKQIESRLNVKQQQLEIEIENAYAEFQTQQNNLKKSKAIISQAGTILSNIKEMYLKGETSIIDFLEAQRNWLDTQQQYYEVKQAFLKSQIQLLYVTGLINQWAL